MKTKTSCQTILTNDAIIRSALKKNLEDRHHLHDSKVRIIEELGVQHGSARIDIAVVNGIMHGYEIKSDKDTLQRLPEQMSVFNAVFDKITLVVGKSHLYDAINMVPDWWGVMIAKIDIDGSVTFVRIRDEDSNKGLDSLSVARLLWREEALKILEKVGESNGFYSKSRECIYKQLSSSLDQETLGREVREKIFIRSEWRPDAPLVLSGD
ncbi:MAG: sce7726 family protein [Patescibacteria group bacterium]|nr:sce7726 family protein [Patescibacteria group bacterium]